MIRFLIGLVAVGAVYLVLQWGAGQPGHATAGMFEKADGGAPGQDGKKAVTKTPAQAAGPARSALTQESPVGQPAGSAPPVVEEPLPATPEELAGGFGRLRKARGAERDRLRASLSKALGSADTVEALLEVLGEGNAFLHSETGRQGARKAVSKILAQNPQVAVTQMSALLERCMQGRITRGDVEAGQLVDEFYGKHKVLVDRVVFNPANLSKARSHPVKPGQTLDGIARSYRKQGVNVEGWTLCYMNRIGRPTRLRAGVTIKIPIEPVWAKMEKESFLLAVYVGQTIVRLYWVAHGADGKTPVTSFKVGAKLANPDWYAPDGEVYPFGHPNNVLGKHFVKFLHDSYQGFGAHGTAEPDSIRTPASLGCIRMYDADIEEFARLVPRGSKVVVAATAHD